MLDIAALRVLLLVVTGWLERRERDAIGYLIEGNRLLRRQLDGRRLRLTDADRRRLAALAHRLGRRVLRDVATVVTPDTCYAGIGNSSPGNGRPRGVAPAARASSPKFDNWSCGWPKRTRRGAIPAFKARCRTSAIAWAARQFDAILKAAGLPPVPQRPTSWQTFLKAHWGIIAGADFFTTEVWTWSGLVTYYTVFVIDFASRRVQILGSTAHPDAMFMRQVVRQLTYADEGLLGPASRADL